MIKNYIFTVTNGRSGQATLNKYIKLYAKNCLSAFEEPNIYPVLPGILGNIEKNIRRRYFATNELLGRGKVLKAYQEQNLEYIKSIAKIRLKRIVKDASNANASTYFDISKFYVRGLYKGFNSILDNIHLVFLVRDPLLNMKSYINRNKNFFLDNSHPSSKNNILKMKGELIKEELYLWSWCETFLRYIKISKNSKVKKKVIIKTSDLEKKENVEKLFNLLDIDFSPLKKVEKINTNLEAGNIKTNIEKKDIIILKNFIKKVPREQNQLLRELKKSVNLSEKSNI